MLKNIIENMLIKKIQSCQEPNSAH